MTANLQSRIQGSPLYPHPSGRWAKKVRGKLAYFGRWGTSNRGRVEPVEDLQASAAAALEQFHREWPYLSQGRTPPHALTGNGCDMRTLLNAFIMFKRNRVLTEELTERAFMDLRKVTDLLIAELGADRRVDDLRPEDFEHLRKVMSSRWGPVRLKNVITHIRGVFKFAFDHRLISAPVNYGQAFRGRGSPR